MTALLGVQDGSKLSARKIGEQIQRVFLKILLLLMILAKREFSGKYHISSFIKRDGIVCDYGTTSAVKSYSYFFEKLKYWMIDILNCQEDCGPA